MATGALDWWRQGSTRRRLRAEAKHLLRESQRILKRKSYRIPQSVADNLRAAITELQTAVAGEDQDRIRDALSALDQLLEDKLSFARKSTIREYSESIGIAVAIALLLRAFVVEAFQIPSGSMIPTLEVGDHIFVAKFSYGLVVPFSNKKILEFREPSRGDVIVFKYPQDPSIDYIKRVVGLPGEKVEVRNNEVFINGKPMAREHVGAFHDEGPADDHDSELWHETLGTKQHETLQEPGRAPSNFGPLVVPAGNVFVMGDNRDNSSDSRVWGTVDHELIKGKALIVWWSRGTPDDAPWYAKPIAWIKSIRFRRFFHPVD
jgi:signal peptidase I